MVLKMPCRVSSFLSNILHVEEQELILRDAEFA